MNNKIVRNVSNASDIKRTLARLAHEIIEANKGIEHLALVGIRTRGAPLADRLSKLIGSFAGGEVPVGTVDITLHRDDYMTSGKIPKVGATEIPFELKDKNIILIDDVLYTGRTVRAAIEALLAYGRPAAIHLAVLVDRGLREMPIQGDFIGKNITTTANEEVMVKLKEIDEVDEILIVEDRELS